MQQKKYQFKFPDHDGVHIVPEVLVYSAYLKCLGVDQNLKFGDLYFTTFSDGENDQYILGIYGKDGMENMEDFELASKSELIRIIPIEEALDIIKEFNFQLSEDYLPIEESEEIITINLCNQNLSMDLSVSCFGLHSTILKAAYIVSALTKANIDCNNELAHTKFFGDLTSEN